MTVRGGWLTIAAPLTILASLGIAAITNDMLWFVLGYPVGALMGLTHYLLNRGRQ